jgi:hypothetical protein
MFGSRAVGRWGRGVLGRNFGVEKEGRRLPYRIWQAIIAQVQVQLTLWSANQYPIRGKAQTGRLCWLDMATEAVWCGDADQHLLLPVETRLQTTTWIPA